jgi:long-chain acyl-CoA synthetase
MSKFISRHDFGQVAVVDGQKRLSYRALILHTQALASHLANDLMIGKGEKVAVFLPNCIDSIAGFFASAELGAVYVPLNWHWRERELQHYVDHYQITAVITESRLVSRWGSLVRRIGESRFVLVDRLEFSKVSEGKTLIEPDSGDVYDEVCSDDDVLYLSTSGSTGRPKIVPRSMKNLIAGAKNVAEALGVTCDDRFLSVVPFYHANGFANCMFLPLSRGATVVAMREFSPRRMLDIMQQEEVTIVFGSPFVFSTISDIAGGHHRVPSVRFYLSSGAPMPEGLRQEFFSKFNAHVRQLYGSSETGSISIQSRGLLEDECSVGKTLRTVEVRIIDDEGEKLPENMTGEVVVRSPAMTRGYLGEPGLNEKAFHKGYFRTGDLGMLDTDDNLYISGRKVRVINAAGVKIDPVEIENVLKSYHKVDAAFVFGERNRRGMEIIKAILVAQPDCTLSEVINFCKGKLADYKIPRIVEFRDDLPTIDMMGKSVCI